MGNGPWRYIILTSAEAQMSVSILPFADEHIAPAAALLAARHQHDHVQHPDLPPRYEEPVATRTVLQELLAEEGMAGVVALCDGNLTGFLLGKPELSASTGAAGFMCPRSAEITHEGHAVARGDDGTLVRRLYTALAAGWVADGLVAHYITVPAVRDAEEPWVDLGFGRAAGLSVRDTAPPAEQVFGQASTITVRRAGADDGETAHTLVRDLVRSFADPPIFIPFLPEGTAARRTLVAEHLADPACPIWLAFQDGRPVGMQAFVEPTSPHWFISPLRSPERCVYLFLACTVPDARSSGIGAALFQQTMVWAQEAGYERCALHCMTASRAAAFWRGLGFRPISHWLCRVVDERITWAKG
jgi:GNAT superfamily N-acetyltransferase